MPGKPPSRSCWPRMYSTARDRARDAPGPRSPASASSAAPVSSTSLRPPRVAKLKPPSASCWRTIHASDAAGGATPAARNASTANDVQFVWLFTDPFAADVRPQLGDEIASAEARRRQPGGAGDEDVPLDVAGVRRRGDARLDVADQAVAVAHDVLRVLAGGGQPERGPPRVQRRRRRPGRCSQAAVGVLRREQVARRCAAAAPAPPQSRPSRPQHPWLAGQPAVTRPATRATASKRRRRVSATSRSAAP